MPLIFVVDFSLLSWRICYPPVQQRKAEVYYPTFGPHCGKMMDNYVYDMGHSSVKILTPVGGGIHYRMV